MKSVILLGDLDARFIARSGQGELYLGTIGEITDDSSCRDHKEFIEGALKPEYLHKDTA